MFMGFHEFLWVQNGLTEKSMGAAAPTAPTPTRPLFGINLLKNRKNMSNSDQTILKDVRVLGHKSLPLSAALLRPRGGELVDNPASDSACAYCLGARVELHAAWRRTGGR